MTSSKFLSTEVNLRISLGVVASDIATIASQNSIMDKNWIQF